MLKAKATSKEGLALSYYADGRKWRQEASVNGAVSSQAYYGGIEYRDGLPYSVSNPQGRAVFDDPTKRGVWTYHYNLKDHLGSTRVVLRDRYFDSRDLLQSQGGSSSQYAPSILQVDDYYPFGLRMEDQALARGEDEQYGYTGQELVDQLDYDLMDYKARWYDPSLGRFGTVDPLASKFPSYTPYNYTMNNPIRFTDPTGMAPEVCCPDGGDGDLDDIKADLAGGIRVAKSAFKWLQRKVQDGMDAVMAYVPGEGSSTDPSGSRDQGTIEGSGVEMMNPEGDHTPRAAGNGPSTPEAKGGSTSIVDYGKGDTPSGGTPKSGGKHQQPSTIVKRTTKVKTSVKNYKRATKPNSTKPDTTFVKRQGRFRHGETDTIIRS